MSAAGENYFRYIPVRQRDVQWGLYVTGAGCTFIPPGQPYPPKNHPELYHFRWETGRTLPEYQVIYISGGEGLFESAPTGGKEFCPARSFSCFPACGTATGRSRTPAGRNTGSASTARSWIGWSSRSSSRPIRP